MSERVRNQETRDVIADSAAAQLLKRAVEIDSKRGMSVSIADLRAAAVEAGISTDAFDDAVAELRAREAQSLATPHSTRRWRRIGMAGIAAIAMLVIFGGYAAARLFAPARAPVASTSAAFELRCIGEEVAAIQLRDALGPSISLSFRKQVLLVRGTPEQVKEVRSILGRIDGPQSSACASRVNRPDTVLRRGIATGD